MQKLIDEQGELQEKIDAADAWDLSRKIRKLRWTLCVVLRAGGCRQAFGRQRRRVALCRLLMQKPSLLLLDEPTNHLDAESIAWLQQHLVEYPGAVILVTLDRYFLDQVTGWILELDRGNGISLWRGQLFLVKMSRSKSGRQDSRDEGARQRTLARELRIRASPKARHAAKRASRLTTICSRRTRTRRRIPRRSSFPRRLVWGRWLWRRSIA